MKKNKMIAYTIFLLILTPVFFLAAFAEKNEFDTDVGIQFTEETSTISSSEGPFRPDKPTVKHGGTLPLTGELLQPIMIMLIGWVCVTLTVVMYLSFKKKNSKKG